MIVLAGSDGFWKYVAGIDDDDDDDDPNPPMAPSSGDGDDNDGPADRRRTLVCSDRCAGRVSMSVGVRVRVRVVVVVVVVVVFRAAGLHHPTADGNNAARCTRAVMVA